MDLDLAEEGIDGFAVIVGELTDGLATVGDGCFGEHAVVVKEKGEGIGNAAVDDPGVGVGDWFDDVGVEGML